MEKIDQLFDLLTEHWKIILTLLSFLVGGGYLVARYRTSGMRKMLNEHNKILDELVSRLNTVRQELDDTRQLYSEARRQGYENEALIAKLRARIELLESREKELLAQINNE